MPQEDTPLAAAQRRRPRAEEDLERVPSSVQPRPWLTKERVTGVADVLEVVAEYACGTVSDACALRGSCKGYRRAVDTTVRRLVYEDQPELRTSRDATLRVHRDSDHLDAVRIALTCDGFPKIARLVVVAIALDGAKDELHEGEACGERPVAASDADDAAPSPILATIDGDPFASARFESSWARRVQLGLLQHQHPKPPRIQGALVRCLVSVCIRTDLVTDAICSAVEEAMGQPAAAKHQHHQHKRGLAPYGWYNVRHFACCDTPFETPTLPELRRVTRLLLLLGPQLTRLSLDRITAAMCKGIAVCAQLGEFRAGCGPSASAQLADALIRSGAPLHTAEVGNALKADDAKRLLVSVPTIVRATIFSLAAAALPATAVHRLTAFNYVQNPALLPKVATVLLPAPGDLVVNSDHVLCVDGACRPEPRLGFTDVARAFPRLQEFSLRNIEPDLFELGRDLTLPSTLRKFHVSAPTATAAALVSQLGSKIGGERLCNLAAIHIVVAVEPTELVDLGPLAAFASTLRQLKVISDHQLAGIDAAALEAVLAKLVALREADIPGLPTARCFLDGGHRSLRTITARRIHAPDAGAPFARLVKACPRLVRATGGTTDAEAEVPAPVEWSITPDHATPMMGAVTAIRWPFL